MVFRILQNITKTTGDRLFFIKQNHIQIFQSLWQVNNPIRRLINKTELVKVTNLMITNSNQFLNNFFFNQPAI